MSDIRKAIMARLGEFARPGAKAEMAASVRRGIDPKKGGQWINGTWDGGTWSAMVFSEPSEAYGIPEFPHISKLAINPKDKPGIGGVIVNYDRGWDIKPSTPELQKAYREIAQIATAEVNKAVKQGWYSRTGEKATMANTSSQEVRSRLLQLQGEISNLETKLRSAAKAGDFRLCHGICRVLTATYEKLGAAYLQWDAASKPTTSSRSGAKAEMRESLQAMWDGKQWKVNTPSGAAWYSEDGKRWTKKHGEPVTPAEVRQYAIKLGTGFSRPGAKAAFSAAQGWIANTQIGREFGIEIAQELGRNVKSLTDGEIDRGLEWLAKVYEMEGHDLRAINKALASWIKYESAAKRGQVKSSRPGAKAKMARVEAIKVAAGKDEDSRTFTAMVNGKAVRGDLQRGWSRLGGWGWTARIEGVTTTPGHWMQPTMRAAIERAAEKITASRPVAKSTNALTDACWQGYEAVGTKKQDGKTVPNCVPKATAAKPESQDIESEEVKAGLKLMEKADEKVSEKIRTLIKEGKPQDQAVAIALDMKRRGEL